MCVRTLENGQFMPTAICVVVVLIHCYEYEVNLYDVDDNL